MKTTLSTYTGFRSIALVASGLMLAIRLGDALSMAPAELLRQAHALYVPQMIAVAVSTADPVRLYAGLLGACFAVFAAAFACRTTTAGAAARLAAVLLSVQIAVGALVESDLLYLVAAELAFVMPHRRALRWLGVIGLSYVVATLPSLAQTHAAAGQCNVVGVPVPSAGVMAVLDWALELAFQAFAYSVGRFAASEWQSRQALALAHTQLASANAALDQAVRAAEQERITARVHEALARHADALHGHLDAAQRQVSDRAAQAVRVAGEQAARLADEVHRAAGAPPASASLDLRRALAALCEGLPSLKVTLVCDAASLQLPPAFAHTVFRVVQEALSNCLRHARASAMHVRIASTDEDVTLAIDDDGHGASQAAAPAGNGLRGMRERIEGHGGRFHAGPHPQGGGFGISVWMPLPREVSR